jgi:hypothetical protein
MASADADIAAAVIDSRMLEHWQRERGARERLRQSLPSSWRNDPRPKMDEVREMYIEGMLAMQGRPMHPVAAIGDDDR